MARMRTVKPEICASEQFVTCSRDARLLFILLWTHCDDAGVHTESMRRIKMELFPADDDATCDSISGWVDELISAGLIGRYTDGPEPYLFVTGWQRHQTVRKPYYRHPKPPGWKGEHVISGAPVQHQCSTSTDPVRGVYETSTKRTNTKRTTSDVDVGAHEINSMKAALDSSRVVAEIGPATTKADKSLAYKSAVLSQVLSEHFLWDSVEAVKAAYSRGSPPSKPRYAYFHGVLSSKATELGHDLKRLLAQVSEPLSGKDEP